MQKEQNLWNLQVSDINVVNLMLGQNLGHVTPKVNLLSENDNGSCL